MNIPNNASIHAEPYGKYDWHVYIPLLTHARALKVVAWLRLTRLGKRAETVDPRVSFHFGLDAITAQWLRVALSAEAAEVPTLAWDDNVAVITPSQARDALQDLVEDIDEFLAHAKPMAEEGTPENS